MPLQPYALIEIHWLPLPIHLKYPMTASFALTGYRQTDGPDGLFSVYVRTMAGVPRADQAQPAKLYALANEMRDRLPEIGERFMLSTGATIVADCVTKDRGEEESGAP